MDEPIYQMTPEEMREFEMDFCVAANMQLGLSYEEAKVAAMEWVMEARE